MNPNLARSLFSGNSPSAGKVLGLYLGLVFLGGSLLAPWAYWGVHSLATVVALPKSILDSPFHRYVNRMSLLIALAGLPALMLRMEGSPLAGLRACFPRDRWRDYPKGCLLGFVSLAGLAGMVVVAGGRELNSTGGMEKLAEHCLNAGLAALAVGFLEEMLFRGVLFRGLRRQYSLITAIGVSSAIYALVHFFRRPQSPVSVEWWSGLQTLTAMAGGFLDLKLFLPAFLNLFLAGSILALMCRSTGTLWFSAGLHAGWIFWLKSYGRLTIPLAGGEGWFFGTSRLIDGWLATLVLTGVGWVCWFLWKPADSKSLPKQRVP